MISYKKLLYCMGIISFLFISSPSLAECDTQEKEKLEIADFDVDGVDKQIAGLICERPEWHGIKHIQNSGNCCCHIGRNPPNEYRSAYDCLNQFGAQCKERSECI